MQAQKEVKLNPVISSIEKLLFEGNRRINQKRNKAILIMGSTGSGKSTLAAYFGKYKLISTYDVEKGEIKIKGQGIAEGYGSETKIPNEILGLIQDDKISIFDCPGFFDTEGLEQEIANAFYNKRLMESIQQIKILFVVSESSITNEHGITFVKSLNNFSEMFQEIEQLSESVAICVTKVTISRSLDNVKNYLQEILYENKQLTPKSKLILDKIINKKERKNNEQKKVAIHLVKKILKEGNVDFGNLFQDIYESIEYLDIQNIEDRSVDSGDKGFKKHLFNVAISEQARQLALPVFDQSFKIFLKQLKFVNQRLSEKCQEINQNQETQDFDLRTTLNEAELIPLMQEGQKDKTIDDEIDKQKNKYIQALNLDDLCSLRDAHLAILETVQIDQVQKSIEKMFKIFLKNLNQEQSKLDLEQQKDSNKKKLEGLQEQLKKLIEDKNMEMQVKVSEEIKELVQKMKQDDKVQLTQIVEKNREELQEQLRVTIEKIKILQFLEKVCGGQRSIDYQKIKEIFKNTKEAIRQAEQKGVNNIQIIDSGQNYQYYKKIFKFLNKDIYSGQRNYRDKMARSQYEMGKIKYHQLQIEPSINHFKLAIEYNDNFDCENFKDIYVIIADIFSLDKIPLQNFQKFEIYSKIYDVFKNKLYECLKKTEDLINEEIKESKLQKYESILDFLFDVNKIRIFLKDIKLLIEDIDKNHETIIIIFNEMIDFIFKNECKHFVQTFYEKMSNIKPIQQIALENKTSSLKIEFKKNFDGLNYMKLLGNKKFNKDVVSWFKILQETKKYVEQIQRSATRKCLLPENFSNSKKFLEKFVDFAKLMPGDGPIRENYGKALLFLGQQSIEEAKLKNQTEKYKEAISYFEDAIQVNHGQNDARRQIADLYFLVKEFQNAIPYYKEIRKYSLVKKCFLTLIENDNQNAKIRENFSEFLKEIGEYEKAKEQLNDAIDIYSENFNDKKTLEIYKKLQIIDHEMKMQTGSAYSKKLADICSDPKKIFPQLQIFKENEEFIDSNILSSNSYIKEIKK